MKTVDTCGNLCPVPLIMTRKAMKEMAPGEIIEVKSDNDTSYKNLMTYFLDQHADPKSIKEGKVYTITATIPQTMNESRNVEDYCEIDPAQSVKDYVIVLNSNKMGEGDDDLGKLLMRAMVNTIGEMDQLPTHILMYNSGVYLACEGSDVVESLQKLEDRGVRVIVCGTCIDFYKMKEKLQVGMISNMFTILETMSKAGHVIKP